MRTAARLEALADGLRAAGISADWMGLSQQEMRYDPRQWAQIWGWLLPVVRDRVQRDYANVRDSGGRLTYWEDEAVHRIEVIAYGAAPHDPREGWASPIYGIGQTKTGEQVELNVPAVHAHRGSIRQRIVEHCARPESVPKVRAAEIVVFDLTLPT